MELYYYRFRKWGGITIGIVKANSIDEARDIIYRCYGFQNTLHVGILTYDGDGCCELYYGP